MGGNRRKRYARCAEKSRRRSNTKFRARTFVEPAHAASAATRTVIILSGLFGGSPMASKYTMSKP